MSNTFTIFQLANDTATYGADAGKYIVTSTIHDHDVTGPMSQRDAACFAALLNALITVKDAEYLEGGFQPTIDMVDAAIADATGGVAA